MPDCVPTLAGELRQLPEGGRRMLQNELGDAHHLRLSLCAHPAMGARGWDPCSRTALAHELTGNAVPICNLRVREPPELGIAPDASRERRIVLVPWDPEDLPIPCDRLHREACLPGGREIRARAQDPCSLQLASAPHHCSVRATRAGRDGCVGV